MFSHPKAARVWLIHEIARDGIVTTVLHVEHRAGSTVPDGLADAIIEYMRGHNDIDRAEVQSEENN